MILFPHTRTRRLSVRLVELTLGQGIALCKLPAERHERTASELLRAIAKDADRPLDRYVTDPLLWTVEERTLLICTYLAHVTTDGPNFAVGGANLSDYIEFANDSTKDESDLGEVNGVVRVMRPLLGLHAQALEGVCTSRGEWLVGAVACQIFDKADPVVDWSAMSDADVREWLSLRTAAILALPESESQALFNAYDVGAGHLAHFFKTDFDDDGLLYIATEKDGAGPYAPARFLASACVSSLARALA